MKHLVIYFLLFPLINTAHSAITKGELIQFVIAANKANIAAIHSGTGHAVLDFKRVIAEEPPDNPALRAGGVEKRDIIWHFSGDHLRVDQHSLELPVGQKRFAAPINIKSAWDDRKLIYVMHFGNKLQEAYINNPLSQDFRFVRDSISYFDPKLFLNVDEYSVGGWINALRESKVPIDIATSGPAGHEVYVIKVDADIPATPGQHIKFEMHVAADQGYNITSLVSSLNQQPKPAVEFSGSYTDGGTKGKVYFPKEYHLVYRAVLGMTDHLDVSFDTVKINCPIDSRLFTFDSMDIPPGTKLYDLRGGKPLQLYYKKLPSDELDKLIKNIDLSPLNDLKASPSGQETRKNEGDPKVTSPIAEMRPIEHYNYHYVVVIAFAIVIVILCGLYLYKRTTKSS